MNEYEIITFKNGDEEMEVLFSKNENTVWLTREDIAGIFNISVSTTRRMLKEIEHNEHYKSYFRSILNITTKRKAMHYNLQILLLIGEKLESRNGLELKRYVDDYIAESDEEAKIDGNEIVTYSNDGVHLNVNLSRKEDTVWLTQKQICILYQTSKSNVSEHIFNILQDKEVDVNSVVRNFRTTQSNGKYYDADFYNLDMILSIGYRVRTTKAVEFRKWATSKLKEFIYANQASNNNTSMVVRDEFNHLYDFVSEMNKRLMEVEKNQKEETLDKIIVEDSRFDALVMMDSLISKANEIIVLIDGYVDIYTLDMFRISNGNPRLFNFRDENEDWLLRL